jgi:hypothetical protein
MALDLRTFTEQTTEYVEWRAAVVPALFVEWQLSDVLAP